MTANSDSSEYIHVGMRVPPDRFTEGEQHIARECTHEVLRLLEGGGDLGQGHRLRFDPDATNTRARVNVLFNGKRDPENRPKRLTITLTIDLFYEGLDDAELAAIEKG